MRIIPAVLSLLLFLSPLPAISQSSSQLICQDIKADLYRLDRLKAEIKQYPGTLATLLGCAGAMDKEDFFTKLGTCAAACAIFVTLGDCRRVIEMLGRAIPEEKRIIEANNSFSCGLSIRRGL